MILRRHTVQGFRSRQTGAIHLVPVFVILGLGLYLYYHWPAARQEVQGNVQSGTLKMQGMVLNAQNKVKRFFAGLMEGHLGGQAYEGGINMDYNYADYTLSSLRLTRPVPITPILVYHQPPQPVQTETGPMSLLCLSDDTPPEPKDVPAGQCVLALESSTGCHYASVTCGHVKITPISQ